MERKRKDESEMQRLSMTKDEFHAVLKKASDNVRSWPPLRNPRAASSPDKKE